MTWRMETTWITVRRRQRLPMWTRQRERMLPGQQDSENSRDVYFADAGNLIIDKEKASIGMLQRMFKIGFNRAARIMDQLCEAGVVGPEEGTKPRKVLMTKEEFAEYMQNQTS